MPDPKQNLFILVQGLARLSNCLKCLSLKFQICNKKNQRPTTCFHLRSQYKVMICLFLFYLPSPQALLEALLFVERMNLQCNIAILT